MMSWMRQLPEASQRAFPEAWAKYVPEANRQAPLSMDARKASPEAR
jgi:hypothetical protein